MPTDHAQQTIEVAAPYDEVLATRPLITLVRRKPGSGRLWWMVRS